MTETTNPWEEWLGKISPIDLKVARMPDRIKIMRRQHGQAAEGETCKGCPWLKRYQHNSRRYWKCQKYGVTRGAATDWRLSWPACALKHQQEKQS